MYNYRLCMFCILVNIKPINCLPVMGIVFDAVVGVSSVSTSLDVFFHPERGGMV